MIDPYYRSKKLLCVEVRGDELWVSSCEDIDVTRVFLDLRGLQLEPSARFKKSTSLRRFWLLFRMKYSGFGRGLKLKDHIWWTAYSWPIKIYKSQIDPTLFDAIVSGLPIDTVVQISMNDFAKVCHAAFRATLPQERAEPLIRSWYY